MRREVVTCDRCEMEVPPTTPEATLHIEWRQVKFPPMSVPFQHVITDQTFDLCERCASLLRAVVEQGPAYAVHFVPLDDPDERNDAA